MTRRARRPGARRAPPRQGDRLETQRFGRWVAPALAVAAGAALAFGGALILWAVTRGPGDGRRVVLQISAEQSRGELAELLAEHGLVAHPRLFALYLATFGRAVRVESGSHLLNDALSPRDLSRRLGRLQTRPSARVSLPEGLTIWQVAERLEQAEICARDAFVRVAFDPAALATWNLTSSVEGYLFPARYDFKVDSRAEGVVNTMVRLSVQRLAELRHQRPEAFERLERDFGFGERELLTLASVIERETGQPEERAKIAGVFYNRLTSAEFFPRQMLQSDPTAAYGCRLLGDQLPSCTGFAGRVTPQMLRDPANPYNTYKHPGLPPGPIANPGVAALKAALEPENTEYLYFVAAGDGRHRFSRTYAEHLQAVAERKAARAAAEAPP